MELTGWVTPKPFLGQKEVFRTRGTLIFNCNLNLPNLCQFRECQSSRLPPGPYFMAIKVMPPLVSMPQIWEFLQSLVMPGPKGQSFEKLLNLM